MEIIEIFKQEYDGDSMVDMSRDFLEAFYTQFNKKAEAVISDEYGIPKGKFIVTVQYVPE